MARVELPESRLRLRKRRRRLRLVLPLLVLVLLVVCALVGSTYISAIRVSGVSVSGTQTLSSSTVEAFVQERLSGRYGYVVPKDNIFLYPKKNIRDALLAQFPVLASVDVHAQDFHTVAVSVVERSPRALWCADGSCLFLDEDGVAYAQAPTFSEPVYTAYQGALAGDALPKHYLSPTEFQALSALVDAIVQKLASEQVSAVNVDADSDVSMNFSDGFVLKFALHDEGGDVFERLGLALAAEPLLSHKLSDFEYLDLRFGDKLYYKLK